MARKIRIEYAGAAYPVMVPATRGGIYTETSVTAG